MRWPRRARSRLPKNPRAGRGDASRHGPNRAAAFSTVVMDRVIGTVALAGLALLTTLPAIDRFHLTVIYLLLVAFFGFSVILVWAVFHPRLLPGMTGTVAIAQGLRYPHRRRDGLGRQAKRGAAAAGSRRL